ncbi:MobF family relaxase [Sphingopyxis panaciterrulae]|uniref:Conjugative relaxase-like TrwC/TraI family protein n=1 Tax=Sphingopyxis panaciterrulae TaxID=462372 RepID=A0A7W9B6W6_9SPHN|nr:MobF family relaxase [Sphingopyxis panaciterrulae]MBB5707351.1 conjugative relaxase-like TrwC/TraI family protein [Sphingopyxis panaciterrulae]
MIHPTRLYGKPGNIAGYYGVGDYYTKDGDQEPSEWGGKLAADLGLDGPVDTKVFETLLAGKVGDQQLGRHRKDGQIHHHPGWDFPVNAPKSVSIMALVGGDERIIAAHERAVGTAIGWLEDHAQTRRRIDGKVTYETTGRLAYARFTEFSSRALDPHLHTHIVILNMTNREGERHMVSLESLAMYAEYMTAGQIYRNDLAHRLRELGYDIDYDPRSGLFEIRGVPKALIADMSQRAEQIDTHAREHGREGQAARKGSFYATRPAKQTIDLESLRDQWATRMRPYAQDLEALRATSDERGVKAIDTEPAAARRATLFGLRQSEAREAVNNLGRLVRTGLASHVGEVRLSDVLPLLREHEARWKLLRTTEPTGDQILTRGRTSRKTARLEIALSTQLSLSLDDTVPLAGRDRILAVLDGSILNGDQRDVLAHLAQSNDRAVGVDGVAGSGKSTLVKVLKDAAEPGWTFIGLAPTSTAAGKLGHDAGIESRTVAMLLATGGRDITDRHVLVVDEAGQLGNRQALRLLQVSHDTGARILFLGDDKQTGAIEQGKAFWLMQQLGLPTSALSQAIRQETGMMKAAVAAARVGDYARSLRHLGAVTSGGDSKELARSLVADWTRLDPESRSKTNILVLDNETRQLVNLMVREVLQKEGRVAPEETPLELLRPAGMTDQEKRLARFYSGGQVVIFSRDDAGLGISRGAEYRVEGVEKDARGRQLVRLVDENGRTILWNPRVGRAAQVNVFVADKRNLAAGDRIQWRLAAKDLDLKNAERGTIENLDGTRATIRWDRKSDPQVVDLAKHKTWDHGYAETVYSSQSKTYDRVYVLAPLNSGLVNGQNYYTAITRARFGVKLWTQNGEKLAEKLEAHSGEKTSALEGLGRLWRDSIRARGERHGDLLGQAREDMLRQRAERAERRAARERDWEQVLRPTSLAERLAGRAHQAAHRFDDYLRGVLADGPPIAPERAPDRTPEPARDHAPSHKGHDR